MFEWYDFYLAAVAAASVWPKLFFPSEFDPALALAVTVVSVGLGYLARPVGAIIFGHLGDRYGRRNTLVSTLVVMGISCVGTAILPPYASIGMLAIVLLFALRFMVGFGLGGETGGALSWIAEARPNSKFRGFWISWPNAVLTLGKLLSIFAFFIVSSSLSNAAYMDWGWRVPFAVGALMLLIGLIVRVKIAESPMFQQLQSKRSVLKFPAFQVMKEQGRTIFKLLWLEGYPVLVAAFVILPYSVSYLVKLGANESFANLSVTAGTAVAFITILGGAYVSDYIGRLNIVRLAGVLLIAVLFPYFFLLNTLNPIWIIVAQMLLYGIAQTPLGACSAIFTESFPTKYRASGAGLTYQLAAAVTGVMISLILPLFIVTYGVVGAWQPVVWVSIAVTIVGIVATFFVRETKGTELE
jgi:MFS family permease